VTLAPAVSGDNVTLCDDDCEDQALVTTDVCLQWKCQTWEPHATTPTRPRLEPVKRYGVAYWTCPKCGGSYGTV